MTGSSAPSAPDQNFSTLLSTAAENRNVKLSHDRLEWLVEAGQELMAAQADGIDSGSFEQNGVIIKPRDNKPANIKNEYLINFEPFIEGQDLSSSDRGHVSLIGVRGLEAIQNYVLLNEVTGSTKPDILVGFTNPAMAAIAKHIGFELVTTKSIKKGRIVRRVETDYEDLADMVFSPRILRIQDILSERLDRQEQPSQKLQKIIEAKGLKIEGERLNWLKNTASSLESGQKLWNTESFSKDGVDIGLVIAYYRGNSIPMHEARITYAPVIDNNEILEPRAEDMSSTALQGIRALQDYIILVEAGCIKKPDVIAGWTSWKMARVAKKFGFEVSGQSVPRVKANYSSLSEAAFSDYVRNMEKVLEERVKRKD